MQLGFLKVLHVNLCNDKAESELNQPEQNNNTVDTLVQKYPECFSGLGKLKNYKLKLHTDKIVCPVSQPPRKIPFGLRKQVDKKLEELLQLDIIEKVDGPTTWISPLVLVLKSHNDVRICVDMRQANPAVIRERYPLPTADDVFAEISGAQVFSKLDLNMGFHQIELEEESRDITTFASHQGLYRYKRLMFGITSAPEVYQHLIQDIIIDCEGTKNVSNDIIVFGDTKEAHDRNLDKVIRRLHSKGLTLNPQKCQFHVQKLKFLGHMLSNHGIRVGPDTEKVTAIEEARQPKNSSEVRGFRGFLGLVNYCARFIPGLAVKAEPLKRLTRSS